MWPFGRKKTREAVSGRDTTATFIHLGWQITIDGFDYEPVYFEEGASVGQYMAEALKLEPAAIKPRDWEVKLDRWNRALTAHKIV